jgi:hypothetical protein
MSKCGNTTVSINDTKILIYSKTKKSIENINYIIKRDNISYIIKQNLWDDIKNLHPIDILLFLRTLKSLDEI